MNLTPSQTALAVFELGLFLAGVFVLGRIFASPAGRRNWFENNRLTHWSLSLPESIMSSISLTTS